MLHFDDRTRVIEGGLPSGEFILYWMRTAVRIDYNPALVTALELGQLYDKPVLVYHAVSERYPFASARHHTFIIEGAQDVSRACQAAGIHYAFHVERKGHRGPHLETLAKQAFAVVTEDMPVPFLQHWTEYIAEKSDTTMYLVDTDCLVPMKLSRKAPTRAFQFRDRFKSEREHRLHNIDVPPLESLVSHHDWTPILPFDPVELENIDIPELVKDCAIDHTVLPVHHTKGGSTNAQNRWSHFKNTHLKGYHKLRNDPLRKGVSRMSAYLHYGMISSFQLAKESLGYGAGGEKYRDELLIWRELAHHWCSKTPMPQHWRALPEWARTTLETHSNDTRENVYSWYQLRSADTTDKLWNLCQQSLSIQGELHNNLRMSWGKQLILWGPPRKALRMALDLNNRFALDGRDPSSYGGILWCFGLFDRPFKPETSVWGAIRPRTTEVHSKRLNIAKYQEQITRHPFNDMTLTMHAEAFVVCLVAQVLEQYSVTVYTHDPKVELSLPTQFEDNHQSKLLIGAWNEAGWLTRNDDGIAWTAEGQRYFQNLWSKIRATNQEVNRQGPSMEFNGMHTALSSVCTLQQYQEVMKVFTNQATTLYTETETVQLALWE